MKTKDLSSSFILLILSISQLFGLSLWFAPNAVFNQLISAFDLTEKDLSFISLAVIIGFVTGSIFSSIFNLPDLIKSQKLFFISAILGGLFNLFLIIANNFLTIWFLRFFTGIFLSGIYPTGMKLTASHFKEKRGLAIGILLSALTIGSGVPYLFNLIGEPNWKTVIMLVSVQSFISGVLVIIFVTEGPFIGKNAKFELSAIKKIYSNKSVRLANYGYFGHMWELYAFWVWIPVLLRESYSSKFSNATESEIIKFFSIGSFLVFFTGGIANIIGGYISDQIGRTKFNIIMLSISGTSSVIIGLMFNSPILVLFVAIIWGITVIPDSPQYSAMVTELAEQNNVGAALTMQTAIGFSITILSIQLIPIVKSMVGWKFVFLTLTIGPILGIISMFELRSQSDSIKIAQGNK